MTASVCHRLFRACQAGLVAIAVAGLLSACTSSGRDFRASALGSMIEGETSFQEAVQLLGVPETVYPQDRGVKLALWRHVDTVLVDAIYFRQELLLLFGPDGRFLRVVDKTNVLASPKKSPVAQPAGPAPAEVKPVQPGLGDLPQASTAAPVSAQTFPDGPIMEEVTVSYPIWLPASTALP